MKKESRDSLKDAGFMHIDEYVKNSIHAGNNCYKQVSELKQYQLASDNFHKPGGDGFSCITSCLQKDPTISGRLLREHRLICTFF